MIYSLPMRPVRIDDRSGAPHDSLSSLLRPAHVTAFVGGGGKTSTMLALAQELCAQGARVTVTTTAHILPVAAPFPRGLRVEGTRLPDEKLGPPEDLARLCGECDFLLIESDGSRSLPVKAPADHEPPLFEGTEMIVAVQGMTAFGRPIRDVSHRPERVCALLGKSEDALLVPRDGAQLLLSEAGQRKNVGSRRYAVVLNQADNLQRRAFALEIAALLPESVCCAITAYPQEVSE